MTLLAALLVAATGCGFHLRGTDGQARAIDSLSVVAEDAYGDLLVEFERNVAGTSIALAEGAPYSLHLLEERTSRRPVAVGSQGGAAEYEVRIDVIFQLERSSGAVVLAPTSLSTRRVYSFDRGSLVGNSEEEELLLAEMRREIAGRMLRRIDAAVRQVETQ